jgi:hypothetical protein
MTHSGRILDASLPQVLRLIYANPLTVGCRVV